MIGLRTIAALFFISSLASSSAADSTNELGKASVTCKESKNAIAQDDCNILLKGDQPDINYNPSAPRMSFGTCKVSFSNNNFGGKAPEGTQNINRRYVQDAVKAAFEKCQGQPAESHINLIGGMANVRLDYSSNQECDLPTSETALGGGHNSDSN